MKNDGNRIIDGVHYYKADEKTMENHTNTNEMYKELLSGYTLTNNSKPTCIADEWLSLAVNIAEVYGAGRSGNSNSPKVDPFEAYLDREDVHPAIQDGKG